MQDRQIASGIAKKLSKISDDINIMMMQTATTTETSSIFWTRIQTQLKKSYMDAKKIFKKSINKQLIDFYNTEIRKNISELNKTKILKNNTINIKQFLNTDKNKQTLNALKMEVSSTFSGALDQGEKDMLRLTALQQQELISKKDFERRKIEGSIPADAEYTLRNKVKEELQAKAIDGKYIKIIDRNGQPRYYNMKSYTNLIVRTKLRQAATAGVINTAAAVRSDLVQVSSHNTTTPFDAQFEGKIYSLSGTDPDFPAASFLPPFHPNCLHSISIVFKSVLERRGLQKYSDFSKGKTEEHPTRTTHIPISNRGAL